MKILFYTGTHFADCSFPLIKSFREQGHDVTCIMQLTPDRCHKTVINIEKQPKEIGLISADSFSELQFLKGYLDLSKVLFANHPMKYRSIKSLYLALKVRNFIAKGNYDVVLFDTDSSFQFWGLVQYLVRGKWIFMVHDPVPHIGWETLLFKFNRFVALKKASKYVLFNSRQVEDFCSRYKINKSKVYLNQLSVYEVYKEYTSSIHTGKDEILFFGRIDKYKGIDYLCEAMKLVHQEFPSAHLNIAGGGTFPFDITIYKELPYITVLNRFINNEEMSKLFSSASIVVCPYIEATQSGVIMSAFAFGKPVIATNVGGLPDMIIQNETGLIVEPREPIALSRAILSLLTNRSLYEHMTDRIDEVYKKGNKSWSNIAKRYIEIINK